jgi:flavin reductase (DIM6/NTAB) family NADH-FMN oxidoreductase RutF
MARVDFDPGDEGARGLYRVLGAVVVPRPIAWVSTTSVDGIDNLAPHSFFTVACSDPAIVQFTSIGRKDSLANAVATGEFVVNLAPDPLFEQVNASATDFPPEVDEFAAVGISREPSDRVRPPRVADSPVAIECVVHDTHDFGSSVVVFGRVLLISVREDALSEGRPDIRKLQPLARLGRRQWSTIGEIREISRIPHEDWPGHFGGGSEAPRGG